MRIIFLCFILLFVLNIASCQVSINNDYHKFQTFNEYGLRGEGETNIKYPCAFVKMNQDTISVIKSNNKNVIMKYINKGEYWYYQTEKKDELYGRSSSIRFITKDTVFIYSYMPMPGAISGTTGEGIIIVTKYGKTVIHNYKIIFNSEDELYKKIRNVASNYTSTMPYYDRDKFLSNGFPDKYYQTFIKVLKGNILYLYDNQSDNRLGCIYSAYKLNSLGEFDLENAKDIMAEVPKEEKCR